MSEAPEESAPNALLFLFIEKGKTFKRFGHTFVGVRLPDGELRFVNLGPANEKLDPSSDAMKLGPTDEELLQANPHGLRFNLIETVRRVGEFPGKLWRYAFLFTAQAEGSIYEKREDREHKIKPRVDYGMVMPVLAEHAERLLTVIPNPLSEEDRAWVLRTFRGRDIQETLDHAMDEVHNGQVPRYRFLARKRTDREKEKLNCVNGSRNQVWKATEEAIDLLGPLEVESHLFPRGMWEPFTRFLGAIIYTPQAVVMGLKEFFRMGEAETTTIYAQSDLGGPPAPVDVYSAPWPDGRPALAFDCHGMEPLQAINAREAVAALEANGLLEALKRAWIPGREMPEEEVETKERFVDRLLRRRRESPPGYAEASPPQDNAPATHEERATSRKPNNTEIIRKST